PGCGGCYDEGADSTGSVLREVDEEAVGSHDCHHTWQGCARRRRGGGGAVGGALDAVVVAARRSPIGTAGHAFKGVSVDALAAPVIASVAKDVGSAVDDVVLGNCMGPGGNVARVAALRAGLGDGVPGVTVDRQCGSGLAAVLVAAQAVRSGDMDVVIAGGAESASTAPVRAHRDGAVYERAPF